MANAPSNTPSHGKSLMSRCSHATDTPFFTASVRASRRQAEDRSTPVSAKPRAANAQECRPAPHGTSSTRAPGESFNCWTRKSTSRSVTSAGMASRQSSTNRPEKKLSTRCRLSGVVVSMRRRSYLGSFILLPFSCHQHPAPKRETWRSGFSRLPGSGDSGPRRRCPSPLSPLQSPPMRLLVTDDLHYDHGKSQGLADEVIGRINRAGGDVLLVVG